MPDENEQGHAFDRAYYEDLERRMQRSLDQAERLTEIKRRYPMRRKHETLEVCAHCLELRLCVSESAASRLRLCAMCKDQARRGPLIIE